MKTPILVGGVVLLGVLGAAGGYAGATLTESSPDPVPYGVAAPLSVTPPAEQLPRKTPEPNNVPALKVAGMTFRTHTFSVHQESEDPVRLSIRMPRGWQLTSSPKTPGEVKFLDPLKERGVRVESGFPPDLTTAESRDKLVGQLKASQPYENDLRILSENDTEVENDDGEPRAVSTLIYTYIPIKTRRYVIVRWIATGGDEQASVEMSVTGLPQDASGLAAVLAEASKTVELKD